MLALTPRRLPAILPRQLIRPCRSLISIHRFQPTWEGPPRVLFCGSDEFSIACLKALNDARLETPDLVETISVVHRRAKFIGRGLKTLKQVPVASFAQELGLATRAVENFKKDEIDFPYDIVIAASFGLLIPGQILKLASHGGLNVHPSLLPDLQGPGPVEHAIIKRRTHTGVTVQTLHPAAFDQGTILAQTPAPGIPIRKDMSGPELKAELAEVGAQMLLDVLKTGKYRNPDENAGWYSAKHGPIEKAPRITKADTLVDFNIHSLDDILTINRALGGTWTLLQNGKRLIMHEIVDTGKKDLSVLRPSGIYVQQDYKYPLLRAKDMGIAEIRSSTYESGEAGEGYKSLKALFRPQTGEDKLID